MRAGDIVRHLPSGESWTVACANDREVWACGWPMGYGILDDCRLERAATDEEHRTMLERWAAMGKLSPWDERSPICREQLFALLADR